MVILNKFRIVGQLSCGGAHLQGNVRNLAGKLAIKYKNCVEFFISKSPTDRGNVGINFQYETGCYEQQKPVTLEKIEVDSNNHISKPVEVVTPVVFVPIAAINAVFIIAFGSALIEILYMNTNQDGSLVRNIPIPPNFKANNSHKKEFHFEFLWPTAVIPKPNYLENIQKKSLLSHEDIFSNFIYYQNLIVHFNDAGRRIFITIIIFPFISKILNASINKIVSQQTLQKYVVMFYIINYGLSVIILFQSTKAIVLISRISLYIVFFIINKTVTILIFQKNTICTRLGITKKTQKKELVT